MSFSRRQSSTESRSLQREKKRSAFARASPSGQSCISTRGPRQTALHGRPGKASLDNMSFLFVNAVEAEQPSMIYNVGSPISKW